MIPTIVVGTPFNVTSRPTASLEPPSSRRQN